MDYLFKSFTQVDASTTRQYGGTGLGLAIGKRLSEMMGGRIWVDSELGRGSTFYFTVVAESVPARQVDYESLHLLFRKRLLIVDDNATNRKSLTLQAQSWGMVPRAASSATEALAWLGQGEPFDLAILDMQMPQIDGLTLAAEIRKQPDRQKLPIIMLTSIGKQKPDNQRVDVKFAACLNKPVKQSQLYNVLLQSLGEQPLIAVPSLRKSLLIDSPQEARPLRILLAEDNAVNQKVALLMLQQMGYQADVVDSGLKVLQALQRKQYDVVLMDVQMPEMDGLETSRQICQTWTRPLRPRIIAMTAHAMQGDRENCIHAGMDDYLTKPIQLEELLQALSKCQPNKAGGRGAEVNRAGGAGEAGEAGGEKPLLSSLSQERISPLGSFASPASPASPAPPALFTSAPIDPKALQAIKDMAGEDASEVLSAVIDIYLEETPKLLQAMESAIAQKDAPQLGRAAHTLKSSSATLGAMNLSKLSKELEAIGFAGTIQDETPRIWQIEAEYETVKAALQIVRQGGQE
jgi:CheY-like chemotaxis protein/HPt (histidine-containing phosphotransfer) domain-containing protein